MATAAASRVPPAPTAKLSTPSASQGSTRQGQWDVWGGANKKEVEHIRQAAIGAARVVRRNLPIDDLAIVASATTLQVVAAAVIKNVPYVNMSKQLQMSMIPSALSSRATWTESWGMSSAAVVHNLAWGVLFALATIATFGKNEECKYALKKHMVHVAIAIASVFVSIAGAISPTVGQAAAGTLVGLIGWTLYTRLKDFPWEERLVKIVQQLYTQNRDYIVEQIEKDGKAAHKPEAMMKRQIAQLDAIMENSKSFKDFKSSFDALRAQHS